MSEIAVQETFAELNNIEAVTRRVIDQIPDLTDEQLEGVISSAAEFEKASFLIRGAATFEIQKRLAFRLAGGRGQIDIDGVGIGSQIAKLASRLGLSAKTLENDSRIFRRFGEEIMGDADPLSREAYIIALGSGDYADDVLSIAKSKKENPGYGIKSLRADAAHICRGDDPEEIEEQHYVTVTLNDIEFSHLKAKAEKWGLSRPETIRYILNKHHNLVK